MQKNDLTVEEKRIVRKIASDFHRHTYRPRPSDRYQKMYTYRPRPSDRYQKNLNIYSYPIFYFQPQKQKQVTHRRVATNFHRYKPNFGVFQAFLKNFVAFWEIIVCPYDFARTIQISTTNQDYDLLGDGRYPWIGGLNFLINVIFIDKQ